MCSLLGCFLVHVYTVTVNLNDVIQNDSYHATFIDVVVNDNLFTLISSKFQDLPNHHLPYHGQCITDTSKPHKVKNFSSHCTMITTVELNKHCYHPPLTMYT